MKFIAAIFVLLLTASVFAADERPNILFFFVDDLGRYAGVYANTEKRSLNDIVKTPNFDRIGREGVIFNNAFVPVASCGPCRASLATGRYFWNCGSGAFLNGKASNWKGYKNSMQTLPKFVDRLQESGYFTQRALKTFAFAQDRPTKAMREVQVGKYQRFGLYVGTAKNESERKA
ncbi:MAG: sulfatase-like hydrolase/transferase, partial [Limisphaerales bacterium]